MRNKLALYIILILTLGISVVAVLKYFGPNVSQIQTKPKVEKTFSNQLQTDEKGSVVVEATPLILSVNDNVSFTIAFTTHSGDLNYDVEAIAKLTDDNGNTYKPISWTGGKGGHHITGTLTFPKLSQDASSVTLTIPGVDNQDRVFKWDL